MFRLRSAVIVALFLALFGTAQADTLKMEGMSAGAGDARPTRGMTQRSVESRFGNPVSVRAAGGRATDYALGIQGLRRLLRVRPRYPRRYQALIPRHRFF